MPATSGPRTARSGDTTASKRQLQVVLRADWLAATPPSPPRASGNCRPSGYVQRGSRPGTSVQFGPSTHSMTLPTTLARARPCASTSPHRIACRRRAGNASGAWWTVDCPGNASNSTQCHESPRVRDGHPQGSVHRSLVRQAPKPPEAQPLTVCCVAQRHRRIAGAEPAPHRRNTFDLGRGRWQTQLTNVNLDSIATTRSRPSSPGVLRPSRNARDHVDGNGNMRRSRSTSSPVPSSADTTSARREVPLRVRRVRREHVPTTQVRSGLRRQQRIARLDLTSCKIRPTLSDIGVPTASGVRR